MSHGIWTTEELVTINKGKDNNLITEFMNESTTPPTVSGAS